MKKVFALLTIFTLVFGSMSIADAAAKKYTFKNINEAYGSYILLNEGEKLTGLTQGEMETFTAKTYGVTSRVAGKATYGKTMDYDYSISSAKLNSDKTIACFSIPQEDGSITILIKKTSDTTYSRSFAWGSGKTSTDEPFVKTLKFKDVAAANKGAIKDKTIQKYIQNDKAEIAMIKLEQEALKTGFFFSKALPCVGTFKGGDPWSEDKTAMLQFTASKTSAVIGNGNSLEAFTIKDLTGIEYTKSGTNVEVTFKGKLYDDKLAVVSDAGTITAIFSNKDTLIGIKSSLENPALNSGSKTVELSRW